MEEAAWSIVSEYSSQDGYFTHQIKWCPPEKSGCIVQYVEVNDPIGTIPSSSYKKPYYEAWLVENGIVLHDGDGSSLYDDSFSNENDGIFLINRQQAIEVVQNHLQNANVEYSYIQFNCTVFWVEKGTSTYETVKGWKRGYENGIVMARELRSSYERPTGLGDGKERIFRANFKRMDP